MIIIHEWLLNDNNEIFSFHFDHIVSFHRYTFKIRTQVYIIGLYMPKKDVFIYLNWFFSWLHYAYITIMIFG